MDSLVLSSFRGYNLITNISYVGNSCIVNNAVSASLCVLNGEEYEVRYDSLLQMNIVSLLSNTYESCLTTGLFFWSLQICCGGISLLHRCRSRAFVVLSNFIGTVQEWLVIQKL